MIVTDSILAARYQGRKAAFLTHAFADAGPYGVSLCGRIDAEARCGDVSSYETRPTCERCAARDTRFTKVTR